MPDDGQVGAEDASERLEDGVGAKGHIVPGKVWASAAQDNGQADRRDDAGSEANAEDEAEHQLLLGLQLQVPDHGNGQQEDPDVGDEVGDVGEVGEGDHLEALAGHAGVPVGGQRAAGEQQGDGDANAPGQDDGGRGQDDAAEDVVDEDAVVEGEDAELDGDEGNVVEVAEDVVALAHHHLVVGGDDDDMAAHAVGRAQGEADGTLGEQADGRAQDEVVVEGDAVAAVPLRPQAHARAEAGGGDGHAVDPVDLGDAAVVAVGLEVRQLGGREGRGHAARAGRRR